MLDHVYRSAGAYSVAVTVCDEAAACTVGRLTVTIVAKGSTTTTQAGASSPTSSTTTQPVTTVAGVLPNTGGKPGRLAQAAIGLLILGGGLWLIALTTRRRPIR